MSRRSIRRCGCTGASDFTTEEDKGVYDLMRWNRRAGLSRRKRSI